VDAFREAKTEGDERKVQELMQKGLKELQVLKVCIAGYFGKQSILWICWQTHFV